MVTPPPTPENTPADTLAPANTSAAPSTPEPVYTLVDVTRTFTKMGQAITPLKGVNLQVAQGEFVTIQGPTGGGKSTLLQMLGGLDRPMSGHVIIGNVDLGAASQAELTDIRKNRLGFVFQSFNLLATLTASENVNVALEGRGLSREDREQRVAAALNRVGLGERGNHRPHELSGGEQQRVAVARAIIAAPQVLLADEPTGNLDEAMRDDILRLLEDLNREGLTIVAVTHDSAVAKRAHRRLHLDKGVLK